MKRVVSGLRSWRSRPASLWPTPTSREPRVAPHAGRRWRSRAPRPRRVNITSTQSVVEHGNPFLRGDPIFDEFFSRFMNPPQSAAQSLGTGVIINSDGFVLTNEHVLAGATQIRVTLADGRQFDAELVGGDPASDLAVVKIKTQDPLPTPKLGDSDDAMIGESVIAIGNPFGLNHTVTTGVLSAINRSIRGDGREYHGFLQTDASINPGNSGGPLLEHGREVIGINTAILGNAQGIGFAIPINRARRIVDDLIRHGEVQATWLGHVAAGADPRAAPGDGLRAGHGRAGLDRLRGHSGRAVRRAPRRHRHLAGRHATSLAS